MPETPLSDRDFDLVSTIYHAAKGARISRQHAADAREANDQEAAAFLETARKQYDDLAARGCQLLKQRL
ncbi:hypothetical protein ACFOGJ_21850 [Marinibaculum pumilum]|uniref:Uncharacterized protein n=1 Tax=Marinibaculum pumilum TaxID=1766165 RepID=A0ABV7L5N8_9PROT